MPRLSLSKRCRNTTAARQRDVLAKYAATNLDHINTSSYSNHPAENEILELTQTAGNNAAKNVGFATERLTPTVADTEELKDAEQDCYVQSTGGNEVDIEAFKKASEQFARAGMPDFLTNLFQAVN